MLSSSKKDSLWVVLAMSIGAIEPIAAKYGLRGAVTPLQLFVVRNIVAALVLSPVLLKLSTFKWQSFLKVLPVSLLLMTTGLCTLVALKFLSAVTVITVVTTTPALVAIINQRLGKDALAPRFWLGFWLAFAGVIMSLEFQSFVVNPIGLVCVFLAMISSSIYRVQMEDISDNLTPLVASGLCFIIIGLLTVAFIFPTVGSVPSSSMPIAIFIGIAAALANVAFVTALNRVGATRISIITMMQRPLLIAAAALLLRERPTIIQLVGIMLVIIGMNYARVTRIAKPRFVMPQVAQTEP